MIFFSEEELSDNDNESSVNSLNKKHDQNNILKASSFDSRSSSKEKSQSLTLLHSASTDTQPHVDDTLLHFISSSAHHHKSQSKTPKLSQSYDNFSLPEFKPRLTNDSGTGDSIYRSNLRLSNPSHYDVVYVFGQSRTVLMANRLDFDGRKVDEYRRRKSGNFRSSSSSTNIPHILPSAKPKRKWLSDRFKLLSTTTRRTSMPAFRFHPSNTSESEIN